jgi:hypothetical protein
MKKNILNDHDHKRIPFYVKINRFLKDRVFCSE